jgi:hypothetical protein
MSEKTDIVSRLRNGAGVCLDEVGGITLNIALLNEAADEIDSLRFELTCVTEERDAALNEISVLTQDRDAARADASCAHDRINLLQNEVRL